MLFLNESVVNSAHPSTQLILILFYFGRIEWIAYDYHSGLDSINWRLFDNFTGVDIIHGHEDIPAQGMANVRTAVACKSE